MDAELMADIGRKMERLEDLVADLQAENKRFRDALEKAEQLLDYGQINAAHQILIAALEKEALK